MFTLLLPRSAGTLGLLPSCVPGPVWEEDQVEQHSLAGRHLARTCRGACEPFPEHGLLHSVRGRVRELLRVG